MCLSFSQASKAAPIDDLVLAAELDDGRTITRLLVNGVDPNGHDERGRVALPTAIREDADKAFRSLLNDPRLNLAARNPSGETPLMLAAIKGRLDWVQALVKKGAPVNQDGWTPLHYACSGPDNGVAQWLISQGADINSRSPNGSTPLMLAAGYGALDLTPVLLKAGADASLRNTQGLSATDFARKADREGVLKQLSAQNH
ncbi:ankyrin repeat domain-containing protein [Roseateles koreensis]|uniref:Ankyrin repeat domain-containing protein n=1 Tax=Roseateles koreensis TaxID=2987526 RepID=A0ABT5KU00_9BURK|nr:ankyrin repeat domain-containing protein [Roseateles koreensis]MDC8785301.1 ankyrin repeat domain-containing protein [Roseateles koreensis]